MDRTDAVENMAHEVKHGVQAQSDPVGFRNAAAKGEGSSECQKLQDDADTFQKKVDEEKPDMTIDEAKKALEA
ncbi:hypothetical protein, partial [Bradyrhizobium sp.]|uniref:hypothetical protein n=1 Tax=Bradyrhizobium sp. TaxID=376 RepID=UPI003C7109F0